MLIRQINKLGYYQPIALKIIVAHSASKPATCPGSGKRVICPTPDRKGPVCPSRKDTSGNREGGGASSGPVRALQSGKCRLGFIPEEWFLFFSNHTGVSGPYFLMLGLVNYAVSKEIYIMEHEYYSGLSVALVLYLVVTRLGPQVGAALDKEVDAVHHSFQKDRDQEMVFHENTIKQCEMAIKRAEGQKELMAAKKENIAIQLEAVYRERVMRVHNAVKGRMIYHIRKNRIVTRIHQRWMIEWVLKNVRKSITPEFQKAALKSAINDITLMASRAKAK